MAALITAFSELADKSVTSALLALFNLNDPFASYTQTAAPMQRLCNTLTSSGPRLPWVGEDLSAMLDMITFLAYKV